MIRDSSSFSDSEDSLAEASERRDSQKEIIEKGIANLADTVRSACPNIIDAKKNLTSNFNPGPADVILARGKKAYNHPGNRRLRQMIDKNLKAYSEATSKQDKSFIVSKIMDTVRQTSKGGGFVREEDGQWYEVGDRLAREKISSSFRDLLHTKYRSSTKAKARLKAKTREPTECSERQQFGLNKYVQSGLMEPPSEKDAVRSHEFFNRMRSAELRNSQTNTLRHASQNPERCHDEIHEPINPIVEASGITNGYNIDNSAASAPLREMDFSGSDIPPLVAATNTSPLSNQYLSIAYTDLLDLAVEKRENAGPRMENSAPSANFYEAMDRQFFPITDEDSDMQSIDWLPDEGPQLLHGWFRTSSFNTIVD